MGYKMFSELVYTWSWYRQLYTWFDKILYEFGSNIKIFFWYISKSDTWLSCFYAQLQTELILNQHLWKHILNTR